MDTKKCINSDDLELTSVSIARPGFTGHRSKSVDHGPESSSAKRHRRLSKQISAEFARKFSCGGATTNTTTSGTDGEEVANLRHGDAVDNVAQLHHDLDDIQVHVVTRSKGLSASFLRRKKQEYEGWMICSKEGPDCLHSVQYCVWNLNNGNWYGAEYREHTITWRGIIGRKRLKSSLIINGFINIINTWLWRQRGFAACRAPRLIVVESSFYSIKFALRIYSHRGFYMFNFSMGAPSFSYRWWTLHLRLIWAPQGYVCVIGCVFMLRLRCTARSWLSW